MKKIVLSLAGVLAATAFAPEASALPAFARQTGMACSACHAQHFPVLNSFGRAFKAGGYTMMGAQGKVEGEHLSLPDTLNAAILLKAQYVKTGVAGTPGGGSTAAANGGNGQWLIPNEFSLFFGGRIAENVGFMLENNLAAGGTTNMPLAATLRVPVVFDLGSAKLSGVVFTTDANGVQTGYELSSGGIQRPIRWSEHRPETSAVQAVGAGVAATGIAMVAQNDMGFINITKWSPSFVANGGESHFGNNYLRIAATPTVADWDMIIGAGTTSGSSWADPGATVFSAAPASVQTETRMTFFDFQAQGQVGGKELSVYAQQASTPLAGVLAQAYGSNQRAWTVGAEYSVIPHALHLSLGYRNFTTNKATGAKNNAWTVGAIYDLAQNLALSVTHSAYSGLARSNNGSKTTFMLESAF